MTMRLTRALARPWLPGMAVACVVAAAPAVAGDGTEREREKETAQAHGEGHAARHDEEHHHAHQHEGAASEHVEAVTEEASQEPDQGRRKPKESWTSGASTSDPSPGDAGAPDGDD